jgi:hypothetical protein
MKQPIHPIVRPLISITAMIFILALSAGMDRWILYLREQNARTAAYIELTLVSYSLAHLLLASLLLALFAWVVLRSNASRLAAWMYQVVGLGITLYPAVYFTPVAEWIRLPFVDVIGARSFFITAGSSIAVTGMAAILRNRRRGIVQESLGATD